MPDPTISRRRAEAIGPFVRVALAASPAADTHICVFTAAELRELVEAFKPE